MQSKFQKEGAESEQFWDLLGEKSEYPSQKIAREAESDPHLFSCTLSNGMSSFSFPILHFFHCLFASMNSTNFFLSSFRA